MTGPIRGVPLAVVMAIVKREGIGPVHDLGLFQSALARPHTTLMGVDAYPDIDLKTAALMHSVRLNHALLDGNNRLAAVLALVLLEINGAQSAMTNDELIELTMALASGEVRDGETIAPRLKVVKR